MSALDRRVGAMTALPEQQAVGATVARNAERLRMLLGQFSSEEVVRKCFYIFQLSPQEARETYGLWSPYRELQYLLGLMLSTPEPVLTAKRDRSSTTTLWNEILVLVSDSTNAYLRLFFERPEQLSDEQFQRHFVAGTAFVHHFNSGPMATSAQLLARARDHLVPFDDELVRRVGLSATDGIAIVEWLHQDLQARLDRQMDYLEELDALRVRSISCGWSDAQTRREAEAFQRARGHFHQRLDRDPLLILKAELEARFGRGPAEGFWRLFVRARGSGGGFTYYTDKNPAESAPLVGISDERAYITLANALSFALVQRLEATLGLSGVRDEYLRKRGAAVERRVEDAFRGFFGSEAEFLTSACETHDGQHEHDLILLWQDALLVVEVKSAPPVEPFRDVEKSYQRLRDAFRRNTGIQGGVDQAERILAPLRAGRDVPLFSLDGRPLHVLAASDFHQTFGLCLTADDFGTLAVDLPLLLKLPEQTPFPWVANINDLESFFEALKLKGWGPAHFLDYLRQRRALQGAVKCADELEVAGMFIRHSRLAQPPAGHDLLVHPSYADVFDEIFMAKQGGPAPDLGTDPNLSVSTDYESWRRATGLVRVPGISPRPPKVGRNDPCGCNSGKKHKKCHGS
jgi:hypothetical protein